MDQVMESILTYYKDYVRKPSITNFYIGNVRK